MATSGSSDFNRTRDQIIHRALRICGIIRPGSTPSAQMVTDVAEALNAMVKRWQKTQLHVWAVAEGVLFPQVDQVKYALARTGADHATETYYQTTLSAAEASGQTTLSVTSSADMTVADYIGIVVDDGTIHWSTIASKTASTVTIDDALDDDAASGAIVFNYTSKIERPLKIVDARRYNLVSEMDVPIRMEARLDYRAMPNKTAAGQITSLFYDAQLSTGYLYLWQPLGAITELVKFTWHRPIMDFDAASDSPDLPQEWLDPLAWNLADALCEEFDVPSERAMRIQAKAAQFLDDVAGDDREGESLFMQADMG
jgi:hypothetical protein